MLQCTRRLASLANASSRQQLVKLGGASTRLYHENVRTPALATLYSTKYCALLYLEPTAVAAAAQPTCEPDRDRVYFGLQVIDHYEKPRNVGSFSKLDNNVGTGLVGAPACGDVMKLQIKVILCMQSVVTQTFYGDVAVDCNTRVMFC